MRSRTHLAWLLGSLIATGGYLYLRRNGLPITIAGRDITAVNLGEIATLFLAGSAAYVFRKRAFIGLAGHLDGWLWSHIYLSLMGLLLVWHHSRGRFSPSERLANAAMLLFFFTAAAGVVTRLLYVTVPRFLGSLPDYDPPTILQNRIGALEWEAASFAALKSDAFRGAYERLLTSPMALPRSGSTSQQMRSARAALPAAEVDDFDLMLSLLEQRTLLRRTLRRRRLYRAILAGWWRIHVVVSLLAMGTALLHILDAIFLRQRLN